MLTKNLQQLRSQFDLSFVSPTLDERDDDGDAKPLPELTLRVGSPSAPVLSAADRASLLQQVRAGEFVGPLIVEIVAYIQRPTPNRNATRFAKASLKKGARSFAGQVVLVDHDQRTQSARIGTILASSFEEIEGSEDVQFRQVLAIAKLHAVESVLDGTIDRFSIGWFPTGPIECSYHKQPMFGPGCCSCWPGDVIEENGQTVLVEAIFTAWEGIEVSAVNVPAVVGTGIEAVRSALSILRTNIPNGGKEPQEKLNMDIRTQLGLPATATDAEVLAAVAAMQSASAEATRLAAENAAKAKQTRIDSLIEAAYADGRLDIVRGADGKRVASPLELFARQLDDADKVEAMLAAQPKRVSVPTSPAALDSNRAPAPTPAPTPNDVNPHLANMLPLFGLTEQNVSQFGPQHRKAQGINAPVPRHLATTFTSRFPSLNAPEKS